MATGFNTFKGNWTGASGIQIGFANGQPTDTYDAFTADPVHSEQVNPNQPNAYRQKGSSIGDVPTNIQADNDFVDYGMGANGWILDNIDFPGNDDPAATDGHVSSLGPATYPGRDVAHRQEVRQDFPKPGHGQNIYGHHVDTLDLHAWKNDATPPNTSISSRLDARFNTSNWPTPFDTTTVAPLLPDIRSTDRIIMRRMKQDNSPIYRRLAVPAANVKASGSTRTPTFDSNVYLQTRTPIPGSYTAPVDPSVSQDALTQAVIAADSDVTIGGDWV